MGVLFLFLGRWGEAVMGWEGRSDRMIREGGSGDGEVLWR
jgi:hypothetical protein